MGGDFGYRVKEHLQHGSLGAFFAGKSWEEAGRMATSGVNTSPGDEIDRLGSGNLVRDAPKDQL